MNLAARLSLIIWLIAGAGAPASVLAEADGSVRASLGGEFDSNAGRVTDTEDSQDEEATTQDFPVVADGLLRFIGEARGRWQEGPWRGTGQLLLGAKRFLQQNSEDLVAYNLRLGLRRELGDWFTEVDGAHRLSRMRRGVRDYSFGQAGATIGRRFGASFEADVHGAVWRYAFDARPEFSYVGPAAGVAARLRLSQRFRLSAGFDGLQRDFDEFARAHTEWRVSTQLDFSGSWLWGVQYLGRFQDSNVVLRRMDGSVVISADGSPVEPEDVARHRLSAFVSLSLPWKLFLSGTAAVLFNLNEALDEIDAIAGDDEELATFLDLANFDENQNQLQIQLRRSLTEALSVEVRYALFASQFNASSANDFVRQTVFLGVTGYLEGRAGD